MKTRVAPPRFVFYAACRGHHALGFLAQRCLWQGSGWRAASPRSMMQASRECCCMLAAGQ